MDGEKIILIFNFKKKLSDSVYSVSNADARPKPYNLLTA